MGSIRNEYHRYLTALADSGASEDTRRLAYVIWHHLDALAALGATRRARSTRLAPLALRELAVAPVEVPELRTDEGNARQFVRLNKLVVGPFRGFMSPESFDLSRPITLVYGANGTGKSSFCEALEHALLGTINEAEAKRINQRAYCDNARLQRHERPKLEVLSEDGELVACTPNEEALRFCFVERNRIEGFARIAARTPGDQRQLIATLFGVDEFNDFVKGFNPDLDNELDLEGQKAKELQLRRQALSAAEQTVKDHANQQAAFKAQDEAWAQQVLPGQTYLEVRRWLLGEGEAKGRLADVRAALDAPLPAARNLRRSDLEDRLRVVVEISGELEKLTAQLGARAAEVSFQQLYEAVDALAQASPNDCPACGTPIAQVRFNPFDRAREGLKQLAELAGLQRQQQGLRETLANGQHDLFSYMQRVVNAMREAGTVLNDFPDLPGQPQGKWLAGWLEHDRAAWNRLLAAVAGFEGQDQQVMQAQQERAPLRAERDRLEVLELAHVRLMAEKDAWQRRLDEAKTLIQRFEDDNRALIAEVEAEATAVAHHQRIKVAYDDFLPRLRDYMTSLPARLLQGLGDQARQFYNGFNREDPPGDLLAALCLPVAENEKLELEFVGEPGKRYDALMILSEGHIRCLGLAILMAKNAVENCPVVIFDDAVNAIDDDHRAGIWRTLFQDGLVGDKQIVLTSHAEEFLQRIEQGMDAQRVKNDVQRFKFLPHDGEHELRVDTDAPTKNYVSLAQQDLDQDSKRDALRNCRYGLENLTDRLWNWMSRREFGPIELKLGRPRAPYELNDKCSKLRAKLRGREDPPALKGAFEALDKLLGVNAGSIEWCYLNSGVHDAEINHEFDRSTVRTIVEALAQLDHSLAELQQRRN